MPTTTWHITFGTYGTRLHGSPRPTVDRQHNQRGTPFLEVSTRRESFERGRLRLSPVVLTRAQQQHIESTVSALCERGGWSLVACAAGPDHVHVLLDVDSAIHGRQVRPLLKRWLTQALDARWKADERASWWAEGGSTKPVKNAAYRDSAIRYILRQRASGE